jgi:hypothetical protein
MLAILHSNDKKTKHLVIFTGSFAGLNLLLVILFYIQSLIIWPIFFSNFLMFAFMFCVSFYLLEANKEEDDEE